MGMHALNGEWQDLDVSSNLNDNVLNNGEGIVAEESSSIAAGTTERSLRSDGRGCYDALEGICSSTPSLDPCKYAVRCTDKLLFFLVIFVRHLHFSQWHYFRFYIF